MKRERGFTLLEMVIVVAIISLIMAIILMALGDVRIKSRDTARANQAEEFLKALELYYLENGVYPTDGAADSSPAIGFNNATAISADLAASGYLSRIPEDPLHLPASGYRYCASNDGQSMALLINTEKDYGGTDYCVILRGRSTGMCTVPNPAGQVVNTDTLINTDTCTDRF